MKKILKLSTTWCSHCKPYAPIFEEWAKNNPELESDSWNIETRIIDKAWDIKSVPATIIIDEDFKLIKKHLGAMTSDELDEFIKDD